jgi:predicted nuclease with TOPRIM domain
MISKVHEILKKINYLEAEIEIQRQILFSLTDDDRNDMETVVAKIASTKNEITSLRQELQRLAPEEHQRIVNIEEALEKFREISQEVEFTEVNNITTSGGNTLQLKDGTTHNCLVKARDSEGNYTLITIEGELFQVPGSNVL